MTRNTSSHCGGTATGWLASANLLATIDLVMCGVNAAWKAAATPMRTSARKPGVSVFADCLVLRLVPNLLRQTKNWGSCAIGDGDV